MIDKGSLKIKIEQPCVGFPSCARTLVQCSEMFMMTRGCNDTETLPEALVLAITLPWGASTSILDAISSDFLFSVLNVQREITLVNI
jgi:hypothetical protein